MDTSASEGPPAGPEKYSYTLRFDHAIKLFDFWARKKSIFETKFSKFWDHGKSLGFYTSLDSKRQELILTEDQAMAHLN